jgi:hypothetical protein
MMKSTAEIHAYLKHSLKGFKDHPADTPFLQGYETAIFHWDRILRVV